MYAIRSLSTGMRRSFVGFLQPRRNLNVFEDEIPVGVLGEAKMTEEEFICTYENYLNRPEIDHWELRKRFCDLHGMDLIPYPRIVIAGLNACRRLNDYALALRFLECVRYKCCSAPHVWPYIVQEICPTLEELGVETPEELCYDRPELSYHDYY